MGWNMGQTLSPNAAVVGNDEDIGGSVSDDILY